MPNPNISSAEMTAYWRCKYPKLSGDGLSEKLASIEGIEKAREFESKFQYPLVGRKVSARAGWFLNQSVGMLLTGQYDSCISLGSGFSLLTYYIALSLGGRIPYIDFVDVDLSQMLQLRENRISKLSEGTLNYNILKKVRNLACDLEKAFEEKKNFRDMFPSCKRPIFIVEGIIYYLSKDCVQWIYNSISEFKNSVVIFDYWPEGGPNESKCFRRLLSSIKDFIPEKVQGLLSQEELTKLCKSPLYTDVSLQEVENEYSRKEGESPQLVDQNEFIPVRLAISQNCKASL